MDYYELQFEDFSDHSEIPFDLVADHDALNKKIARDITGRIQTNNAAGRQTTMILPVGPLDYTVVARICNERQIDMHGVTVYMMDEYVGDDGSIISRDHPLSFRRFMKESLIDRLDAARGMTMDQVIFPTPASTTEISEEILARGGVEICYGGFGITGHFAFNDPPAPDDTTTDLDDCRNSRTRVLDISRESITQMVMGGTHGNWELVPDRAVSLGMKELLASDAIHLTFMRTWHAGVLRRALFGPVSVDCPGSLLQEHDQVHVTVTEAAAERPVIDVSQDTGE